MGTCKMNDTNLPEWVDDNQIEMTDNARKVFTERYLRKGEYGNPVETVAQCFYRVASNVAQDENRVKSYYELMSNFHFLPNTPTFTGAGTPLGQLAACFVLPIEDDMQSIFETLKIAALIQQSGGGVGFSFSNIRQKGALINKSMGMASGPIGFLKVYDAAFGEIAQGGTRRGANMANLSVEHPDIEEFIECKAKEGEITNFNISVAITDEFMQSVKDGVETFALRDPKTKEVVRTVNTLDLYNKIIQAAHRNGEPGLLFFDRANEDNPLPNHYTLVAVNPCGEQFLGPYESCNLGSINLSKFVTDDDGVDWQGLKQTVQLSTQFLDDVISANKYIPAFPQIKEAAMLSRRIGLGFMGLADMFYSLGVGYGSDESIDLVSQITEFIRYHSMNTSIDISSYSEYLSFPAFNKSIYADKGPDNRWEFDKAYECKNDWGRPELDWKRIGSGIRDWGIRNSTTLTVAPTGTLATVSSLEGYGCEPVFALGYTRILNTPDGPVEMQYHSELFKQAVSHLDNSEEILEEVAYTGSCQNIEGLPDYIKDVFVVSQDVTPEQHVNMQVAIQKFVDNSISKTCNLPAGATYSDVSDAYMQAWLGGAKGITVYVQGSRQEVVLATKETQEGANCTKCPQCGYSDCG